MCVPHTGSEAWTRALGLKQKESWRPWKVSEQVCHSEQVYCVIQCAQRLHRHAQATMKQGTCVCAVSFHPSAMSQLVPASAYCDNQV